ncbi:TolC family protein [Muricoccus radiodurans]|uniref:TolC family protein n=1 Tax=Muricoccus radiodurans TaxID=2231721 RepID=UPI003CE6F5F7
MRRSLPAVLAASLLLVPLAGRAQNAPPAHAGGDIFGPPAPPPRRPAPVPARAPALVIGAPAITLAEAEARLVERNLAVIAARRGVDVARAQRLVADTSPAGSVGLSQSVAQVNEGGRFREYRGERFISPLNNLSLNLTLTIERGGKRELRNRYADQQISVAEAQVLDALRAQVFNLRQAFIAGLQARANLAVAVANRAALDTTEGLLRRQVQEGAIPEGDLLRFQASRLPFEQDVAGAAQAYAAASAMVAALLGEDATRPSAPAPRGSVAALLAPVPLDLRGEFEVTRPLGLSRQDLAAALPRRADVVAAERGVTAAEANIRLQEAARSRDVTFSGTASRTELSQDLPNASRPVFANNTLGLGVSIPIFTAPITRGNIAVAQAQQGQARAQADAALAAARAEFATAWATYEQARALLELTTGPALRRAQEAYESTEAAYRAGGRTLLDTLDALRTLNATRVAANAARAAYLLALAALEQASGVDGIAPHL